MSDRPKLSNGVVVLHDGFDEVTDPFGVPSFTIIHEGLTTTRRPHRPFQWGRLPSVPYIERYPPKLDVPVDVSLLDVAEALFLLDLERERSAD